MLTSNKSAAATYATDTVKSDTNFFNGAQQTLTEISYDPLLTGYAFIKWVGIPKWVEDNIEPNFKALTEKNFRSFSGLDDMTMETIGMQAGFSKNETHYATALSNKPMEFTLKHKEFSGSPVTKAYNGWVSGIRDPRTNTATYPVKFNVPYAAKNHTGALLYVMTKPSIGDTKDNIIEFACYITNVMPKKIILGAYNFESGSHDNPEVEQTFTGVFHFGAKVEAFAQKQLASIYSIVDEDDGFDKA